MRNKDRYSIYVWPGLGSLGFFIILVSAALLVSRGYALTAASGTSAETRPGQTAAWLNIPRGSLTWTKIDIITITRHDLFKEIKVKGAVVGDPGLEVAQQRYLRALKVKEEVGSSVYPEIIKKAEAMVRESETQLRKAGMSQEHIESLERTGRPLAISFSPEKEQWIQFSVSELELPWLKEGMEVAVAVSGQPGHSKAILVKIEPVADPKTYTVGVLMRIDGSSANKVLRGQSEVCVRIPYVSAAVALPPEAIVEEGAEKFVWVKRKEGIFERRPVQTGPILQGEGEKGSEDLVAILEGVREGEQIQRRAAAFLDLWHRQMQ